MLERKVDYCDHLLSLGKPQITITSVYVGEINASDFFFKSVSGRFDGIRERAKYCSEFTKRPPLWQINNICVSYSIKLAIQVEERERKKERGWSDIFRYNTDIILSYANINY